MRYLGKPWMSIANLLQEAGMLSWASKSGRAMIGSYPGQSP